MLVVPSTTCRCGRLVHAHVSAVPVVVSVIAGIRVVVVAEDAPMVCVIANCSPMVRTCSSVDVVSIACSRVMSHIVTMCAASVVVSVNASGIAT